MAPEYLPENGVSTIIQYFESFMKDESIAPSKEGKRAFFQRAVERTNFLPEPIQELIDANRKGTPQPDYLFLHTDFNLRFSEYQS